MKISARKKNNKYGLSAWSWDIIFLAKIALFFLLNFHSHLFSLLNRNSFHQQKKKFSHLPPKCYHHSQTLSGGKNVILSFSSHVFGKCYIESETPTISSIAFLLLSILEVQWDKPTVKENSEKFCLNYI